LRRRWQASRHQHRDGRQSADPTYESLCFHGCDCKFVIGPANFKLTAKTLLRQQNPSARSGDELDDGARDVLGPQRVESEAASKWEVVR
jgi:hypothetical protein